MYKYRQENPNQRKMMVNLIMILVIFLISCGPDSIDPGPVCEPPDDYGVGITIHMDTPLDWLEDRVGYSALGYAVWDDYGNCTIYLAACENIPNQICWDNLVQHELMHCFAHDFHPHNSEGSYVPGC